MTLSDQIKRNALALISLFVAFSALGYNTWRNEVTEENRNIRKAGFEVIVHIGALQRISYPVLHQYWFDGFRAIQSVQDKARVAGNGHSLSKSLNAVLDALGCSLRASQKAVIHVVALLVKGATIPFKVRLVANRFLTR